VAKVNIKIDGIMVLTVVALGAATFVYLKRDDLLAAIDPTNQENLINQAAESVIGVDNLQTVLEPAFEYYDWVTEPTLEEMYDPTSQNNSTNRHAEEIIGVDNLQTGFTPFFELYDWITE